MRIPSSSSSGSVGRAKMVDASTMLLGSVLGLVVLVAAVAVLGAGCDPLKCGEGTREEDGRCVPTSLWTTDGGVHCGTGTILVGNECVPTEDLCGEFTRAVPLLDEEGNPTGGFLCVGEEPSAHEKPPECPEVTTPGRICVNGYVRWLLDDNGKLLETVLGDPEGSDATTLEVRVYDPLLYSVNSNVAPLAVGEVSPRNGTFRVENVQVPATGFIALVVDEDDSAPEDIFAFAGIPYAAGGANLLEVTAVAISQAQAEAWTEAMGGDAALAAAGCAAPFGGGFRTLSTCGTWIGVFDSGVQGDPQGLVEGVVPYFASSAIADSQTFYLGYQGGEAVFDVAEAGVVWSDGDGPHEHTGRLGTVFVPGATLGNFGGVCAPGTPCEEAGCSFPLDQTGGAAKGALFVQYVFPTNTCSVP